jgi:hypothetical protein
MWTYSWHALPQGPYTITATVETDVGCKQTDSIDVNATNTAQ